MMSVTALAFFLSLRQHEPVLSIIGAVGGLGLLYGLSLPLFGLLTLVYISCWPSYHGGKFAALASAASPPKTDG